MNITQQLQSGLAHHQAGRLDQATLSYKQVLGEDPDNADALNLLGLVAYQRDDYAGAVQLIGKSLAINPRFCQAQINFGNALIAQNRYADATVAYDAALEIEKNHPDALYGKGACALTASQYENAEQLFKRVTQLRGKYALAWYQLGKSLQGSDKLFEALTAYEKASKLESNNVRFLLACAGTLQLVARYEDAVAQYQRVLKLQPDNAGVQHDIGLAWHKLGKFDEAESAFRMAIEMQPDLHLAHAGLGNILRSTGRPVEAITAYNKALQLKPNDPEVHCFLSAAWLESGNSGEAMMSIERSRQLNPYDRRAMAYEVAILTENDRIQEAKDRLLFDDLLKQYDIELPDDVGNSGFESSDDINNGLKRLVREHPSLEFERTGNTTQKGAQTGNLLETDNNALKIFVDCIDNAVTRYISELPKTADHPYFAWQPDEWQLVAWGVVLDRQGHQLPHVHPDGWLSGVYYLQVPESVSAESEQQPGCLEIGRAPDSLNCTKDPLIRVIEPREGCFVLFPSFFYHRTIPFESDQQRISIAFDVKPVIQG